MANDARRIAAQQIIGEAGLVGVEHDKVCRNLVGEGQYFLIDIAETHRADDFSRTRAEPGGQGL